jgi:hypothetical protein
MTLKRSHLIACSIIVTFVLALFWLYRLRVQTNSENYTHKEEVLTSLPVQPPDYDTSSSDHDDFIRYKSALDGFSAAYKTLANSTVLPSGSTDPTGKLLPNEFVSYLADEESGHGKFLRTLSTDGGAAYQTLGDSLGALGVVHLIKFVGEEGMNYPPSSFDFFIYSTLQGMIREYPSVISRVDQESLVQHWNLISHSSNPVYRLSGINEARRVVKDEGVALALLNERTNEVDGVILNALIDQFALIGGDAAKAALTRISKNAVSRGDQNIAKVAGDAIAKLDSKQ